MNALIIEKCSLCIQTIVTTIFVLQLCLDIHVHVHVYKSGDAM